jgi:hypothetical protein
MKLTGRKDEMGEMHRDSIAQSLPHTLVKCFIARSAALVFNVRGPVLITELPLASAIGIIT